MWEINFKALPIYISPNPISGPTYHPITTHADLATLPVLS
jgi:hypothetical protein